MILRIASLNVRGLHASPDGLGRRDKRGALFQWMKSQDWDIILLQETHANRRDQVEFWTRQWGGQAIWALSPSPHTGGTAILIHPRCPLSILESETENLGNWTRVKISFQKEIVNLISVHHPAEPKSRIKWIGENLGRLLANKDKCSSAGT